MSTREVSKALEFVRSVIHQQCAKMSREHYMEFCEELSADMDGAIDALKEENRLRGTEGD